jgi:hypothetical protein
MQVLILLRNMILGDDPATTQVIQDEVAMGSYLILILDPMKTVGHAVLPGDKIRPSVTPND